MVWKDEMMNYRGRLLVCILILMSFCGCTIRYSAVGVDIPIEAQTITIRPFQNNASLVYLQLSNELTTQLRDKFRSNTRLSITESRGDLHIEGEITGYSISSEAVGADRATMSRLTITVRVRYENKFDEKKNLDQTFSRYQNFDANLNLQQEQTRLVPQICEVLVDDIFNATVGNW